MGASAIVVMLGVRGYRRRHTEKEKRRVNWYLGRYLKPSWQTGGILVPVLKRREEKRREEKKRILF
jgi:hypothetical protein